MSSTKHEVIGAWLSDISGRWEHQPDSAEIHMAFPSKMVRTDIPLIAVHCVVREVVYVQLLAGIGV